MAIQPKEVPPDGSRLPATPLSLLEPLNIDFLISGNYSRIENSENFCKGKKLFVTKMNQ